jgi:hypothetical protein
MPNIKANSYTITDEAFGDYYIKVQGERFSVFKNKAYKSSPLCHKSTIIASLEYIRDMLINSQLLEQDEYVSIN